MYLDADNFLYVLLIAPPYSLLYYIEGTSLNNMLDVSGLKMIYVFDDFIDFMLK